MKKLSIEEKYNLRIKMVESASQIGISETARIYKVNRNTVSHWLKRFRREGEAGLKNRSKKSVNYPNKMPLNIEKKIISYKKKNPDITATQIIKDLNINYSVSVVTKKLKNAGLWNQRKVHLNLNERSGIEPCEVIFIDIFKVDKVGRSIFPGYIFIAMDYATECTWISYSYDNYEPSLASFIEYIIGKLGSAKEEVNPYYIVPLKKSITAYTKRKKSKINNVLTELNCRLKQISETKQKEFKNKIEYKELSKWYQKQKFKSLLDLLAKTYVYNLERNLKLMQFAEPIDITPKIISYYGIDSNVDQRNINLPTATEVNTKALKITQKRIEDNLNNYDYFRALDLLRVKLALMGESPEELPEKIETLLLKGELLKNCGTLEDTENILTKAHSLAKQVRINYIQIKTSFSLGEFYSDIEANSKALEYYEQSLKLSKIENDKFMESKTAINLALLHLKTGRSRKTLGILIYYLKKAKAIGDNSLIVDFYMGMARYYNVKGNQLKVTKYLEKAEFLANESGEPELFFKVLYPLLSMSFKSKMPDDFIASNRDKMKDLIPKLTDRLKTLNALNAVGCAEINLNNYDDALKIFVEQLQLAEKLGLKFMICSALINIGNRFMNVGKNSNALNYLIRGYELSKKIQYNEGLFSSCINISNIYSSSDDFDNALQYNRNGYLLARQVGNKYYQTWFLLSEGAMLLDKKQPEAALVRFRKGMRLAREIGNKSQIATAYNNISVALNNLGKIKPALQNINKALDLVLIYKSKYHHCLFSYNKSRYLYKNDELQAALKFLDIAESLAVEINNKYVLSKGSQLREKISKKL